MSETAFANPAQDVAVREGLASALRQMLPEQKMSYASPYSALNRTSAMDFEVLTKTEAADRARISPKLLNRHIKAGTGPALLRIGACVRIRSDSLQQWLESLTAQQMPSTGT